MNVLYVVSELYPLIKTGGLADVAYSLPHALKQLGVDIRILIPGYGCVLEQLQGVHTLDKTMAPCSSPQREIRLLEGQHDDFDMPIWVIDSPHLFDRPGNPYMGADGYDWDDNAERFANFSYMAAEISMGRLQTGWPVDVVHTQDWQTGLVSAFLSLEPTPPKRVFTIHNVAYGGHFSNQQFRDLNLPNHWWQIEGVEFYGGFSMLKAGIVYSDVVTTVSPTYADEICTPFHGCGLEGVLESHRGKLIGILNGVDEKVWDPATDSYLQSHYSADKLNPGKRHNKMALLEKFNSAVTTECLEAPLFGMVGRLVKQKGIDLIVDAIPEMIATSDATFIVVGTGNSDLEAQLQVLADQYPDRFFVHLGYSEVLAHLVEAGSDLFLMPSRFEPCGLNQLYSQRYGTLPIVHHTGGLADTVVDATQENMQAKIANGFVFYEPTASAFTAAMKRALTLFDNQELWRCLQQTAMQQEMGWKRSAEVYLKLY